MKPFLPNHRDIWLQPPQKWHLPLTLLLNTQLPEPRMLNYSPSAPTRVYSNQIPNQTHSNAIQRGEKAAYEPERGSQLFDLFLETWRGIMQTCDINIKSLQTLFSGPCRITVVQSWDKCVCWPVLKWGVSGIQTLSSSSAAYYWGKMTLHYLVFLCYIFCDMKYISPDVLNKSIDEEFNILGKDGVIFRGIHKDKWIHRVHDTSVTLKHFVLIWSDVGSQKPSN